MQRKTTEDFPVEVLKLFDGYIHGRIDRRAFLDGAAKFAVGGFTAAAMLEALKPNYALAQQVAKDDPRIKTSNETYPSPQGSGTMGGYLARPANAAGRLPGIIVIHENRGVTGYIEDVSRRLAVEGYLAFAPDALYPVGGNKGDDEAAGKLFSQQDRAKRTEDFMAAFSYMKSRPDCNGKIGAIGFCFGGGIVNEMAVRFPDLAAAAPFYGAAPSAENVAKIKAPLQMHYASSDDFINPGRPAFEAALKANGVRYEMFEYAGTTHGFHNDTTPRYNEAAAKLAWSRTLAFFNKYLKG
jgi:carboxymethylenebutenolidase